MTSFIEELFYNNINPKARMVRNGSNLQKQMEILANCEERLTRKLAGMTRKRFWLLLTLSERYRQNRS